MRPHLFSIIAFCLALVLTPRPAAAEVSADQWIKILLTALGFNRTIAQSDDYEVTIAVVGECEALAVLKKNEDKRIAGKPIRVLKATETTFAYFDRLGVNVLYLCALPENEAKLLFKVASRLHATVAVDRPEYVELGGVMGVGEFEGRPRLRINMKAAREAKLEFDPRLLGNAEVVAD